MEKISAELFFQKGREIIDRLEKEQMENIKKAARVMAQRILNNGVVHIFGPGHSKSFAMELVHRAGGLAPCSGIALDDLVTKAENPITYEELRQPETERDPQTAHELLNIHDIQPGDVMIICSNSGRNGSAVELALEMKKRGIPLIGVTSLSHSKKTEARHPSGKRLFEIADIVIDNCGPYGDAAISLEAIDTKVCSVSSVSNMFIAQALTAETIKLILAEGETPPVFISLNVDGADEHNEKIKTRYEGRVHW